MTQGYTIKDLKNNAVKVISCSKDEIILQLDWQRIVITPFIFNHDYEVAFAFLDYEFEERND